MTISLADRKANAVSAIKMLLRSRGDLQWTTTTLRARSGDSSVLTVTGIYLDGTEMQVSLDAWLNISNEEIQDGLFPRNGRLEKENERKRIDRQT